VYRFGNTGSGWPLLMALKPYANLDEPEPHEARDCRHDDLPRQLRFSDERTDRFRLLRHGPEDNFLHHAPAAPLVDAHAAGNAVHRDCDQYAQPSPS
jgi:hypothetical protein